MRGKLLAAFITLIAVAGCVPPQPSLGSSRRIYGPADFTVYWDLPETREYWVPKGTNVKAIREAASICGASVDGGMFHHIPVPPQYAWGGFHFVGSASDAVKACVINRVQAVPALTAYEKKR